MSRAESHFPSAIVRTPDAAAPLRARLTAESKPGSVSRASSFSRAPLVAPSGDATTVPGVAAALFRLAAAAFGPGGSPLLVQVTPDKQHVVCTSSSRRLWEALLVEHAVARLLLQPVRAALDGGLATVLLTSGLVRAFGDDASLTRAPRRGLDALDACAGIVHQWLDATPLVQRVDVSDMEMMLAVAESALRTKRAACLDAHTARFLAIVLVQTLLDSLAADGRMSGLVRFFAVPGIGSTMDSSRYAGVLVDVLPPDDAPPLVENVAVALFNVSLFDDDPQQDTDLSVAVHDALAGDEEARDAREVEALRVFGQRLIDAGVGLVACQKLVHPWLRDMLHARGIMVLERLSIRHMDAVALVAGGIVLSGMALPHDVRACLGFASRVERVRVGRKQLLSITNERRPDAVATVALVCKTVAGAEDLEAAARAALDALRHMLADPHILPGQGAWMAELAAHMRSRPLSGSTERAAAAALATALECTVRSLGPLRTATHIAPWSAAADMGLRADGTVVGLDAETGDATIVRTADGTRTGAVDTRTLCARVLDHALDTAASVLRVRNVLVAQ